MKQKSMFYLLGALRDGNFDIRKGKNYSLRIYQKYNQWLYEISEIIFENYNVKPKITGNLLRLNNKKIVEEMIKDAEYKKPQKFWNTPSIVEKGNDEEKWEYVSGFWDADGGLPKDPRCVTQKYISFSQKSKETLEFIKSFLLTQGIQTTNLTYTGQIWQIRITRKEGIKKFFMFIRSRNKEKFERLKLLIASLS